MTATVREYGRDWDARVPRGDVSWLMGRVHDGTPDEEIAADIRARTASQPGYTPALIEETVAYALVCHLQNQDLYRAVVTGRLSHDHQ